jgi:Sulfotransferase domain
MKRPNFYVIGAPRCGTTALYTYLRSHPNIFLPEIKELHYFASDFPNVQKILFKSEDDYLKMFADANENHLAVGEISPLYIYSKVALRKIKEFNPAVKLIVIVRNPVEFVQSVHQLNLGLLREDEPDLAKAWDLQEVRRQGKLIPAGCREPELIMYGELGCFGKHLEKVFEVFPKEQVLIVLFNDFVKNPKQVYEEILAFLGVPSDHRQDFPPVNSNYEHRSKLLGKLIHPPQFIYKTYMKLISLFGIRFMRFVSRIYSKVETLNARRVSRSPIDPALYARIQAYFQDDIRKLSELIHRDLSAWTAR